MLSDEGKIRLITPGDRVVVFTDGLTESCDAAGEEFGAVRLLQLLQEQCTTSGSHLREHILACVNEFDRGHWQDDATLLVLAVGEERSGLLS